MVQLTDILSTLFPPQGGSTKAVPGSVSDLASLGSDSSPSSLLASFAEVLNNSVADAQPQAGDAFSADSTTAVSTDSTTVGSTDSTTTILPQGQEEIAKEKPALIGKTRKSDTSQNIGSTAQPNIVEDRKGSIAPTRTNNLLPTPDAALVQPNGTANDLDFNAILHFAPSPFSLPIQVEDNSSIPNTTTAKGSEQQQADALLLFGSAEQPHQQYAQRTTPQFGLHIAEATTEASPVTTLPIIRQMQEQIHEQTQPQTSSTVIDSPKINDTTTNTDSPLPVQTVQSKGQQQLSIQLPYNNSTGVNAETLLAALMSTIGALPDTSGEFPLLRKAMEDPKGLSIILRAVGNNDSSAEELIQALFEKVDASAAEYLSVDSMPTAQTLPTTYSAQETTTAVSGKNSPTAECTPTAEESPLQESGSKVQQEQQSALVTLMLTLAQVGQPLQPPSMRITDEATEGEATATTESGAEEYGNILPEKEEMSSTYKSSAYRWGRTPKANAINQAFPMQEVGNVTTNVGTEAALQNIIAGDEAGTEIEGVLPQESASTPARTKGTSVAEQATQTVNTSRSNSNKRDVAAQGQSSLSVEQTQNLRTEAKATTAPSSATPVTATSPTAANSSSPLKILLAETQFAQNSVSPQLSNTQKLSQNIPAISEQQAESGSAYTLRLRLSPKNGTAPAEKAHSTAVLQEVFQSLLNSAAENNASIQSVDMLVSEAEVDSTTNTALRLTTVESSNGKADIAANTAFNSVAPESTSPSLLDVALPPEQVPVEGGKKVATSLSTTAQTTQTAEQQSEHYSRQYTKEQTRGIGGLGYVANTAEPSQSAKATTLTPAINTSIIGSIPTNIPQYNNLSAGAVVPTAEYGLGNPATPKSIEVQVATGVESGNNAEVPAREYPSPSTSVLPREKPSIVGIATESVVQQVQNYNSAIPTTVSPDAPSVANTYTQRQGTTISPHNNPIDSADSSITFAHSQNVASTAVKDFVSDSDIFATTSHKLQADTSHPVMTAGTSKEIRQELGNDVAERITSNAIADTLAPQPEYPDTVHQEQALSTTNTPKQNSSTDSAKATEVLKESLSTATAQKAAPQNTEDVARQNIDSQTSNEIQGFYTPQPETQEKSRGRNDEEHTVLPLRSEIKTDTHNTAVNKKSISVEPHHQDASSLPAQKTITLNNTLQENSADITAIPDANATKVHTATELTVLTTQDAEPATETVSGLNKAKQTEATVNIPLSKAEQKPLLRHSELMPSPSSDVIPSAIKGNRSAVGNEESAPALPTQSLLREEDSVVSIPMQDEGYTVVATSQDQSEDRVQLPQPSVIEESNKTAPPETQPHITHVITPELKQRNKAEQKQVPVQEQSKAASSHAPQSVSSDAPRTDNRGDVRTDVRDLRSQTEMFKTMTKMSEQSPLHHGASLAQLQVISSSKTMGTTPFIPVMKEEQSLSPLTPMVGTGVGQSAPATGNFNSSFDSNTNAFSHKRGGQQAERSAFVRSAQSQQSGESIFAQSYTLAKPEAPAEKKTEIVKETAENSTQKLTPYAAESVETASSTIKETAEESAQSNFIMSAFDRSRDSVRSDGTVLHSGFQRIAGFSEAPMIRSTAVNTPNREAQALPLYHTPVESFAPTTSMIVRNFPAAMGGTARIVLTPETLGTVVVQLRVSEQQNLLRIEVESHETRSIVEAQLPLLHEQLAQSGVRMENIQVHVTQSEQSFAGTAQQQGQSNQQQRFDDREARAAFVRSFSPEGRTEREQGDSSRGGNNRGRQQQQRKSGRQQFEQYA